MIVGVDTDVLVNWIMDGSPHHESCRKLLDEQVQQGNLLGISAQVLYELIHICTDPRRFEKPLTMAQSINWSRSLWDGKETVRLAPKPAVLHRTLELLKSLKLGRKRILDTALAAALEDAGIKRLVTLNARDYEVFSFLQIIAPW